MNVESSSPSPSLNKGSDNQPSTPSTATNQPSAVYFAEDTTGQRCKGTDTDSSKKPALPHQQRRKSSTEGSTVYFTEDTTDRRCKGTDTDSTSKKPALPHQQRRKSSIEETFNGRKSSQVSAMDDSDSEDQYDWSTNEDLVDEDVKLEMKMRGETEHVQKGWGVKKVITFFLSTLIGSTLLAATIAAVPLVLHFYYLNPQPTDRRQYVSDNVSAWLYWIAANLPISWGLAMIVDSIPVFCNLLIALAWGEINETVRSRIELYNAAKDKIKPVLYGASAWVSWLIIFRGIYKLYDIHNESNSRAYYTPRTYQAIKFLFFFTLVLFTQQMLSHLIAFAFHRKAYSDRLEALKHDLQVIDHLRNYRPKRHIPKSSVYRPLFSLSNFVMATPAHERTGFNLFSDKQDSSHHHVSRSRTLPDVLPEGDGHEGDTEGGIDRPSKPEKTRHNWIFPSVFSRQSSQGNDDAVEASAPMDQPYQTFDSHTNSPATHSQNQNDGPRPEKVGGQPKRPNEEDETVVVQAAKALKSAVLHDARNITGKEDNTTVLGLNVNSAHEAKHLAKSIYVAFKGDHHRKYLIPSDLYPAYARQQDAEEAFRVFDKCDNGDISRAEIKTKILKLYKERRALSRSLRDVSNALKTLDGIMLFFAVVILFFISLSIFNIAIGSSLTSFYTIGIAASFIFKNTASSAFDAVIFIFVTHPFDTGDRVFVDHENLIVKKMGLFATTFTRADGTEIYYFNSQLFIKFITNVRRSGTMFENATFQVAWRTPLDKLDKLEKCMNEWLATEENRWFDPHTAVTLQKIEYQRYLEFTMAIGHNGTWQDWGLRNTRKTAFLAAAHFYCRQLGITFYESSQPVSIIAGGEQMSDVGLHIPASPALDAPSSPKSPGQRLTANVIQESADNGTLKPVLGFIPPQNKIIALTRARKSRLRKGNIRGAGEPLGDG